MEAGQEPSPARSRFAVAIAIAYADARHLDAGARYLGRGHGSGARAFSFRRLPLFDGVFDLLTFGQIIKTTVGDGRMVKENILTAIRL